VVEEHKTRAGSGHRSNDLVELAAAYQRGWIGMRPVLNQHRRNRCACRPRQFLKFGQRGIKVQVRRRSRGIRYSFRTRL